MQEKEALIDIFDEDGTMIEHKERGDVNKRTDILKVVQIMLINDEGKVFVTKLGEGLYQGKWASSAAGIVRHDEALADAASRTLKRELGVSTELTWDGENFYNFDGIKRFMSVFHGKTNQDPTVNEAEEGKWVTIEEAEDLDSLPALPIVLEIIKDVVK